MGRGSVFKPKDRQGWGRGDEEGVWAGGRSLNLRTGRDGAGGMRRECGQGVSL